jgi:tRNA nucleotidyltransferase/poly(A) polymerase
MADYIYTLESRLTPDQMRGVILIQELSRAAGLNVYLTGGAVRDILTGFSIRDLDFTLQGNPLKLQKELEKAGAVIHGTDDHTNTLYLNLPGNVRAEISMSRSEQHLKTGKPPVITPATITEDLRRRDFTINAMALSLNEGSKGLLQDPFNGVADLEAKLIRILQNYSFLEDPSRLIRATRFAARFAWPLEERTQQRFDAAKEGNYIGHVSQRALGYEIEQLAYEDDPLHIVKTLEKEGWLSVLHAHWTTGKIDVASLTALMKTRQQMTELGYWTDPSPAVLHFLTSKLAEKDRHEVEKAIPRKGLVEGWRELERGSKDLAKRLSGKEAATPSKTWQLLSSSRPEALLFLAVSSKQQAVSNKIRNFFTKWREVQKRIPLPEMTELLITPAMAEYPAIAQGVFMLLLDGKLRSQPEIMKYLKPLAPPPPPPPPPPRRGRAAKAAAAAVPVVVAAAPETGKPKGKGKGKEKEKEKDKAAALTLAAAAPAPAKENGTSGKKPAKADPPAAKPVKAEKPKPAAKAKPPVARPPAVKPPAAKPKTAPKTKPAAKVKAKKHK